MKIWQIEIAVTALILGAVVFATGAPTLEWVGAGAVLVSFAHGQVANRLAEKEAHRTADTVHCYKWAARYWVLKESLWIVYFVYKGAYSALAGCLVFLLYPVWRQYRMDFKNLQNP